MTNLPTLPARRGLTALALLLAGTALTQPTVLRAQQSDATVLQPIRVSDGAEAEGTVAATTRSGSKTDAALQDLSAAVSVVTEAELKARGVQKLTQALSYTAGVSADEYGSDNRYDFYRIRGFNQTSTGTYLDGLPMRTLSFTSSRLEPYGVERLDVLKGSTSTLFGLNAPGGLVNATSKKPRDAAFGEVYSTLGDGHAEAGVDFGAPLDDAGRLAYRLTMKWQDGQDGSDYMNDDRVYIAPALTWKPGEATVITFLGKYQNDEGNTGNSIPAGSTLSHDTFFGEPDFSKLDREEVQIGYELAHDFGGGLTFRQVARYSELNMHYQQAYLDGAAATGRTAYEVIGDLKRFGIDNQLQYDARLGGIDSRTLIGLDHTREELFQTMNTGSAVAIDLENPVYCGLSCISLTNTSITDMDQTATGLYAQQELTWDDRWILTLGLRKDWVETETGGSDSNKQDALTRRVGLTYKPRSDLSLYANYSESFQPVAAGYVGYLPSAPQPQEGTQYELGAKVAPEGMNALFTLAYFDLSQTNVPRWTTASYEQIGQIDVRGLELEGRFALADRLNLNLAYSYWDAAIVGGDTDGNRPLLVPEHLASLWIDYTLPDAVPAIGGRGDLTLGAGLRYLGARYADDANTSRIGSAVVVDAMASYQLARDTALSVNVTNLLDKAYVATPNFTGDAYYYGDGRTVQVTLRRTW